MYSLSCQDGVYYVFLMIHYIPDTLDIPSLNISILKPLHLETLSQNQIPILDQNSVKLVYKLEIRTTQLFS